MIRSRRDVSRIEGFSDAVFGFALTLPGTAPGRQWLAQRDATRASVSFIDASAPVSSSRERQVQKRM
jgi:hypothetical protein